MVHTVPVKFGLVFPKRSCYSSVLRSSRVWVGAQCTPVRQQRNSFVSKLVLTASPLCDGSVCITFLPQILHAWNEASNVYPPPAGLHRTNHYYSMGIGNQEEIPLKNDYIWEQVNVEKWGRRGGVALIAQSKRFSSENSMNMETMQQMHYAQHQIYANDSDHLFGAFSHYSWMSLCWTS